MANPEREELRHETIDVSDRPLDPGWIPRSVSASQSVAPKADEGILEGLPGRSPLKQGVLSVVRSAREVLCLSSFLFADEELERALLDAASRGVRVYLLTASEHRLRLETGADGEVDARRFEEHSRLLARLAGRILVRTGEDLHAKFVVSDPTSPDAAAVLSTANFTSDALAGNLELGVRMAGGEAKDLGRLFIRGFWSQSQHELLEPDRLHAVRPEVVEIAPQSLLCTASGILKLREDVDTLLSRRDGELLLSSYGFEKDHGSVKLLREAASSGRQVRALTRRRSGPRQGEAVLSLVQSGVQVRAYDSLHAKCVLNGKDGSWRGLLMSANLEKNGLDHGYEAGVALVEKRAARAASILQRWWEEAPWEFRTNLRRGDVVADTFLWVKGRFVKTRVGNESPVIDLGRVEVDSEGLLASARPPRFPEPSAGQDLASLYHRNRYTWRVRVRHRSPSSGRRGIE